MFALQVAVVAIPLVLYFFGLGYPRTTSPAPGLGGLGSFGGVAELLKNAGSTVVTWAGSATSGTDSAATITMAQASTRADASWELRLMRCSSSRWVTRKTTMQHLHCID